MWRNNAKIADARAFCARLLAAGVTPPNPNFDFAQGGLVHLDTSQRFPSHGAAVLKPKTLPF